MANEKEIRTKIGSVKNTQKITKAMEMVAASKMEGGEIDYMSLPSKAERRDNRNNDDNYSIQQSGCY